MYGDYDLPVAPKLITVKHAAKMVDAVAQGTKFGFLFVFNRLTGEPLWPVEERPVPQSDVPGEWTSPTQPFPTKPPAFARQSFTEKDINPYIPAEDQAKIRDLLKSSRNEGLFTPPSMRGTIRHIQGASWGTIAVDPTKVRLERNPGSVTTLETATPKLFTLNFRSECCVGWMRNQGASWRQIACALDVPMSMVMTKAQPT